MAKVKTSTETDEEMKNLYVNIHKTNQISNLISAISIFLIELNICHKVSVWVMQFEKDLHGDRRQALLCLRVHAGSNADVERLLSFEADPGLSKKITKQIMQGKDAFFSQSFLQSLDSQYPNIKKWFHIVTKVTVASFKVTLFLVDVTKDLILWVVLYVKSEDLGDSALEHSLLWIFFSLIFLAQSIIGLFITSNFETIFSLPAHMSTWKKCFILIFMFLLTPCLPSLVIFKATIYSTDMAAIVADARNNPSSLPSRVLQQIKAIKEKHRIHMQIYSYAR